ncbi:hypothetical protein [Companilactobacillus ginsenosidimutans]|uniref:Uncharacterized protein n=1 Tax=Companilactobacillus ginsenosidimutans TaxID=1007676 RepID=A0A0H4QJD1_9LACO|nr:hypothetical protein [Companilactobacillus ginsenosidimutans]AKP68027.1 hypothetical protein ABM34_11115 [Companilactobacillus ginsenosidimutans]
MDDHKKYTSFKIAFGFLLVSTIILSFSKKSRVDLIISLMSALAVAAIYLYFKLIDLMDKHKKLHKTNHV